MVAVAMLASTEGFFETRVAFAQMAGLAWLIAYVATVRMRHGSLYQLGRRDDKYLLDVGVALPAGKVGSVGSNDR
ncbi:hypothetical protein [Mycolicibacterium baixiangningiae]|uniref:hypothetical protein n=1 Tax=Mycolicibacterium baixiangningiae TaxID=2761578 RepID=UPI00186756C3|nr:hypothetical protein [Mycolicibacterium baixiangningiae]